MQGHIRLQGSDFSFTRLKVVAKARMHMSAGVETKIEHKPCASDWPAEQAFLGYQYGL